MAELSEVSVNERGAGIPKAPIQTASKTPEVAEKIDGKVDLLMVFGQGPVKPLLRISELENKQKVDWETFKANPLHGNEPDFRVIDGVFEKQLEGLTEVQIQEKMVEWQTMGRLSLNRWGRENALASGFALVSGYADKVLLSGGKTIPAWAKEKLLPGRLEKWPSEAQLMADIIRRRFGKIYQEKYGQSIDEALILEYASTNTLENLANSINTNPDLLKDESTLGLLATNFHIDRSEKITGLFAPGKEVEDSLGVQTVLGQRSEARNVRRAVMAEEREKGKGVEQLEKRVGDAKAEGANTATYKKILEWMIDPTNPDLIKREGQETRWTNGLVKPEHIKYWFGYIGKVEDPSVLQATIQRFRDDPAWTQAAKEALQEVGLSLDDLANEDLTKLPKENFAEIAGKLAVLSQEGYRTMPPPPAT